MPSINAILKGSTLCCLAIGFSFSAISVASAIECKGPLQVVRGHGEISTPYCQDNYLAKIARSYGHDVTNREIRENPNKKEEICRHVGFDIRVTNICASVLNFGSDRNHGRF